MPVRQKDGGIVLHRVSYVSMVTVTPALVSSFPVSSATGDHDRRTNVTCLDLNGFSYAKGANAKVCLEPIQKL